MSFRGRSFVRGIFIIPWATPTFVAAFAWIWLLDAQYGIFNMVLTKLNILSEGIPWLGQLNTALLCVILAHVWKGLPWVVMVLLSGLQMVPKSLQEAARVDGANAWKEFWNVIVPSMKNVLLIVILLRVIWTFNWFDYVYLLTGGGPLDATTTWPVLIYKTGFEAYRFGRAS
ncbi:MAG: sugar ABC transporter permease, partial [Bacteroidetes bacterium]|nr:sugar ABC transporter permease [Bacteroidota bacterium]